MYLLLEAFDNLYHKIQTAHAFYMDDLFSCVIIVKVSKFPINQNKQMSFLYVCFYVFTLYVFSFVVKHHYKYSEFKCFPCRS